MDRAETVKVIDILKSGNQGDKGFSLRRTIKTLQRAERERVIAEYRDRLGGKKE